MQNVLPDQVTLGYILRSCNPRPWDGSDQYLVRTVSFEIPFLDFCSNFVQVFFRVLATRINNKTYGLDTPKPQRRSGPLFRMQSVRTVSRRNLIIKWWRFSYFLNPHFIPNKLIGGFFSLACILECKLDPIISLLIRPAWRELCWVQCSVGTGWRAGCLSQDLTVNSSYGRPTAPIRHLIFP